MAAAAAVLESSPSPDNSQVADVATAAGFDYSYCYKSPLVDAAAAAAERAYGMDMGKRVSEGTTL